MFVSEIGGYKTRGETDLLRCPMMFPASSGRLPNGLNSLAIQERAGGKKSFLLFLILRRKH